MFVAPFKLPSIKIEAPSGSDLTTRMPFSEKVKEGRKHGEQAKQHGSVGN